MQWLVTLAIFTLILCGLTISANAQSVHSKLGIEAGLRNLSWIKVGDQESITPFVVNANVSTPGQFPYHVSLQVQVGLNWYHICGGFLVRYNRVVTAAHCLILKDQFPHRVAVGWTNLAVGGQVVPVAGFVAHERYSNELPKGVFNDVAILKLNGSATPSSNVQTVDLTSLLEPSHAGEECVVVGYDSRPQLTNANQVVLTNEECRRFWSIQKDLRILPEHVCAYNYPSSFCGGDSGGPLVCGNKVIGIVSFGLVSCSGCFPGVFARTSWFSLWLNRNLK